MGNRVGGHSRRLLSTTSSSSSRLAEIFDTGAHAKNSTPHENAPWDGGGEKISARAHRPAAMVGAEAVKAAQQQ